VKHSYNHGEFKSILTGCHLGIVPVLWDDNLPQIAIEMVAYGVPVLTSSAGGAKELCDNDLFIFESGNTTEFIKKLTHFVDKPTDLKKYWKYHKGLVTLPQHWNELRPLFKIKDNLKLTFSEKDYYYLKLEHDFLTKNLSIREERFTPQGVVDNLNSKISELENENRALRKEKENMEKMSGHITFRTEYNPIMGDVGANLFKFTLPDFNFSDFYAEIRFLHLSNVAASFSDTLKISGTWHNETGKYEIHLHQMDWERGEKQVSDFVWIYLEENSVCFFARYAGLFNSISYDILTLNTRAETTNVKIEKLRKSVFVDENELRPKEAFNSLILDKEDSVLSEKGEINETTL
jgi:hypothetical protein